jgi:hypothetical protein
MGQKLVIIHTTPVTVVGLKEITSEYLKDCSVYNLLDDSILPEIIKSGGITEGVKYRFNNLLMSATTIKPDIILCACSSIGELAENGRYLTGIPVLRIDEAMAEEAVLKAEKIGIAATLPSTLGPTERLLQRKGRELNKRVELQAELIEDVNRLLSENREDLYDLIVSEKLIELSKMNDIVVLAQASMARALLKIPAELQSKFLTSPKSGIGLAKKLLGV